MKEKKIEKLILDCVRTNKPTTLSLVSDLRAKDPSLSESLIRRMVWRLVDRGHILLTQDRTLAIIK